MPEPDYYIGLISGTSIDGVDCALVQFNDELPTVVATYFNPTPPGLRDKILTLCKGSDIDLRLYGQVDIEIGRYFAGSVKTLLQQAGLSASQVTAIGSHGQTVFHEPNGDFPFTLQIGDPNTIAQLSGITTVADFRRRDMVVGGEGAPLAPLLHRNCFASKSATRVIVNIGGISNITVLTQKGECFAFDTGPGNVLMDYWIEKNLQQTYDKNGDWGRSGAVNPALLDVLLQEPYFQEAYPKSTGRELFNGNWLEQKLTRYGSKLPAADVQASLLELTVQTLHNDIEQVAGVKEIYICGGGAQNGLLMRRLNEVFPKVKVESTSSLGVHPDWVEATAFAWMAKQTYAGIPIDTTALTGARQATILGGIYRV